jgi:hypothetical protein
LSYKTREEVKAACVPCAIGHFSTSARLLNEAVRFRADGLKSPQVLDDIAAALGEQNALERIDLTPEKIRHLPDWEQEMAQMALDRSRELRHKLETVTNMDELRDLAADTEEFYKILNRDWQSKRIDECPDCATRAKELKSALTRVGEDVTESPARRRQKFLEEIRRGK